MGAYIIRRVAAMAGMLIALSVIVFLLFSVLPADPARLVCGKSCTPPIIKAIDHEFGYDQPVATQYRQFVEGILVGRTYGEGRAAFRCNAPCLGYSFLRNEDVTTLIADTLPITAQLALGGFVLWIIFGVGVGIVAALKRGKWQDRAIMGGALVGYSFPSFFIALLLIFFVQIKFGVLGFHSYVPIYEDPLEWFKTFILPWIAIALLYAAFYSRLTRNQMLETLGEDYIRTARAKGLPERTVIGRHALRAGLAPIVTSAGLDLADLLGGAIIIEQVFALPGIGRLSVDSVTTPDLPVITGTVIVAGFFLILANLVVDLLYAVIDPRVRLVGHG
ncbi:MAG: peptide/nickel transport system permease protein [Actinomycetota bacterium]|jgi:peptide/nickel transport system permease protein|nr:peptide/nickel transport system permease protein [Actinomycetota bacterium]